MRAEREAVEARRRDAYRIEDGRAGAERIFTIVAPSGARLYSFSDWASAQAEAAMLNASE